MIRRAGPDDVAALRAIAAAAYEKYISRIGRAPAPVTADYARPVSDGQAWAAVQDGQVVGFAILIARPGYLLLENVAVLPNEAMIENIAYYTRHGYVETGYEQDGFRRVFFRKPVP